MTRSDLRRNAGFAAAIVVALALSPLAAFAKPVVQNDAATAVQGWLKQPGHGLKAPLGNAIKNTDVYTDAAGAPLYFVVNLNPSGFVIVPADDLAEPILCFSPAGKYVASEKNPLGALVMHDVPARLALARAKRGRRQRAAAPERGATQMGTASGRGDCRRRAAGTHQRVGPSSGSAHSNPVGPGRRC